MTKQPELRIFAGDEADSPRLMTALREREAELAAGVPIAIRPEESRMFAERLEAILAGAVNAVGCSAAGLYMLDDGTSCLKLRASFGLPADRLLAPPRPLVSAIADLEALVGHAVVLEDTQLLPHWKCPEEFPAAACVPVSSPTTPLGTLWVFCDRVRDFSSLETNLLECVAGRIAAELEREMLLASAVATHRLKRERDGARDWQQSRLPTIEPLLDDYEVAGYSAGSSEPTGSFFDWTVLPDGRLALLAASSQESGLAGALAAASLQSAIRSHLNYPHTASQLLSRVSETLWTGSAGDQLASLVYAILDPETGRLEIARAGRGAAVIISTAARSANILVESRPCLGVGPDAAYPVERQEMKPGESLLLIGDFPPQGNGKLDAIFIHTRENRRQSGSQLLSRIDQLLFGENKTTSVAMTLISRRA